MVSTGNTNQWREGYPSLEVVGSDIERDGSYVIEQDGRVRWEWGWLIKNNANYIRMTMELLPEDFKVKGLRVEYRVAAKLGDILIPTLYQIDGGIIVSLSIGSGVSALIEFT